MSHKDEQRFSLVEVTWVDSMGYARWRTKEELRSDLHKDNIMLHKTSGYLFEDTDKYMAIVQSYNCPKEGSVDNVMQIPKVAIQHVRYFSKKAR